MITEHTLDEENIKLKEVITKVLDENMTSQEKSMWGYEYALKHKQFNDDLDYNIRLLKEWGEHLKQMGNANHRYAYAIDRLIREVKDDN